MTDSYNSDYSIPDTDLGGRSSLAVKDVWQRVLKTFNPIKNVSKSISKQNCILKHSKRKQLKSHSLKTQNQGLKNYWGMHTHRAIHRDANKTEQIMKPDKPENNSEPEDEKSKCGFRVLDGKTENNSELDLLINDIVRDKQRAVKRAKCVAKDGFLCKYQAALKKAKLDWKFFRHEQNKGIVKGIYGKVTDQNVRYGISEAVVEFENVSLDRIIVNNNGAWGYYLPAINMDYIYYVKGLKAYIFPNVTG